MNIDLYNSDGMKKLLQVRKGYLQEIYKKAAARLKQYPEGKLRISHAHGNPCYYHRKAKSDRMGSYINKEDTEPAVQLACKDYDQRLSRVIEQELKAINSYEKSSPVCCAEAVYEKLPDFRRALVEPLIETDEMYAKRWLDIVYERKGFLEGSPEFLTDNGERVRSKSEVIIANMLTKAGVPYRYEYPVMLNGLGQVYPDFTVLNVKSRREFYWEHLGMMDNPKYVENALHKIISYNMNQIYPGDQLLLTFETKSEPINVRLINSIIKHYLL